MERKPKKLDKKEVKGTMTTEELELSLPLLLKEVQILQSSQFFDVDKKAQAKVNILTERINRVRQAIEELKKQK